MDFWESLKTAQIARLRLVSAPSSGISVAGEAVLAVLAEERAPPRATRPGMFVGVDLLVVRSLSRVCHESFSRFLRVFGVVVVGVVQCLLTGADQNKVGTD